VRAISRAIENPNGAAEGNGQNPGRSGFLTYHAPWKDDNSPMTSSVDTVMSQSVLQNISDLRPVLSAMLKWLRPGGIMSHEIDLSAIGRAREWNGHWRYPALLWRLMRGRRPWFLSRRPHSAYLAMMTDTGFRVTLDLPVRRASVLRQQDLASEFRNMTDDDLTTCSVFVQAVRP
jgi:SAM-dependent methyltransferase